MRKNFTDMLEQARLKEVPFQTPSGEWNGSYSIPAMTKGERLYVICSNDDGWDHVSVSVQTRIRRSKRCPTWEEMAMIKEMFWDDDEAVFQLHPPKEENVSMQDFCLHLWKSQKAEVPRPPSHLVGLKPGVLSEALGINHGER